MTDPSTILKNTLAAVTFMQRSGWKVKKSKVYLDAKEGRFPRGQITVADAEKYALRERLPRLVEVDTGELSRISKQQAETDLKLSNKKLEKLEFELAKDRGQYLPRDQFGQELSARMVVLRHGLRHISQSRAAEYLEIGKAAGVQAMADRIEADHDDLLNDYANRETFQVIVLPDGSMQPE